MSESLPKNDGKLSAELEQLSVVDVLEPVVKPIKKYMEYAVDIEQKFDHPNYKFQIDDIQDLIESESELVGKTFVLPGYDVLTQIKCNVKFDSFKISVIFLNPEKVGEAVEWRINPKFAIIIGQNPDEKFKSKIFYDILKYGDIIVYGEFYQICKLSYSKDIETDVGFSENSTTLHMFVEKISVFKSICLNDDDFLWKVDVSKLNLKEPIKEMTVVGLSPYFSSAPEGLKVQILLFISKDDELKTEVRFLNEFEFPHNECKVWVKVMHPTEDYGPMSHYSRSITFSKENAKHLRYSSNYPATLNSRSRMLDFVFKNKLFVNVTMIYT